MAKVALSSTTAKDISSTYSTWGTLYPRLCRVVLIFHKLVNDIEVVKRIRYRGLTKLAQATNTTVSHYHNWPTDILLSRGMAVTHIWWVLSDNTTR